MGYSIHQNTRDGMNNEAFITRINQGDEKAYGVLFELYYDKLLYIAVSYVGNREDAQEIVQDVFVKIWKKRNLIDGNRNINNFLYLMTRNACLDFLRKRKSRLNIYRDTLQEEALVNYSALADDVSSSVIEKELEKQVLKALELLPEKCKTVFVKSRFEGLKRKEISEELHISVKTVENHLTRALKHMRVHLQEFLSLF